MKKTNSSRRIASLSFSSVARLCLVLLSLAHTTSASVIFRDSGSLATSRYDHSATVLADGKVLIAGGTGESGILATAELYDPQSETYSPSGSLATARSGHTATLLPNHKVLVIGSDGASVGNELYDPASGTWSAASPCLQIRNSHTATLLPNGKVLVVGGKAALGSATSLASAELYDPEIDAWTTTDSLSSARGGHTATLLKNGKVLVVGGIPATSSIPKLTEIYDPQTGLWEITGELAAAKDKFTATLLADGRVLVVNGSDNVTNRAGPETMTEIYDPETGMWTTTLSPNYPRFPHTATLLSDNTVLVSSGYSAGMYDSGPTSSYEIYHPDTGTWSYAASPWAGRRGDTVNLLGDGRVLITGGAGISQSEIYVTVSPDWTETSPLHEKRHSHSNIVLPNGKVLIAGGIGVATGAAQPELLSTAELFDPETNIWEATGSMASPRAYHSAVLLPNGKVLVVGNGAEIYDTQTGTWSSAGSVPMIGDGYSATLMRDGTVLAAGPNLNSYLYSCSTNSWRTTGPLHQYRAFHTATLLADGRVFVYGGTRNYPYGSDSLGSCEIYTPKTGLWSEGPNASPRSHHVAALLPSGRVLVCGGDTQDFYNGPGSIHHPYGYGLIHSVYSAQIYDPSTSTWAFTSYMSKAHACGPGVTLPDGRILVTGGHSSTSYTGLFDGTNNSEIYDETSGLWTPIALLNTARTHFTGAILNDGRVFVAGGLGPYAQTNNSHVIESAEIYDFALPEIAVEQPQATEIPDAGTKDFGKLILGTEASLQFTIRNKGTVDLTGLSLTMEETGTPCFSVTAPLAASVIAPDGQVVFTVRFAPTDVGTKTARLHIASNDTDESHFNIKLTGSAYVPSPEIVVEQPVKSGLVDGKAKSSFDTVKVGKISPGKVFTIKNTGTANLTGLLVRIDGTNNKDFIAGPPGKSTLSPGASTTFKVNFNPSAKGICKATIHIRSNDADESPFDINLSGMGASR